MPITGFFEKKPAQFNVSDVVSIISHQLKTPLGAIKNILEMLEREEFGPLNKDQLSYVKDARSSASGMINLVNTLLDVSRIEQDRFELVKTQEDLKQIIQEAIKEFEVFAKAHNCVIIFDASQDVPPLLLDRIKISQVVKNLVSNAVNYNKPGGKIEISLSLKKVSEKEESVSVCVKDEGIGIKDEEKEKIFQKFFRSKEGIEASVTGTGLGLFIAKAIVEKSGGKMWFDSKAGQGSAFYFSLPLLGAEREGIVLIFPFDDLPGSLKKIFSQPAKEIPVFLPKNSVFGQSAAHGQFLSFLREKFEKKIIVLTEDDAENIFAKDIGLPSRLATGEEKQGYSTRLERKLSEKIVPETSLDIFFENLFVPLAAQKKMKKGLLAMAKGFVLFLDRVKIVDLAKKK